MGYIVTLAIIALPLISGMIAYRFYTDKEKPYVFFCTAAITSIFGAFCVAGGQTGTFESVPWLGWVAMVGFGLAAITIPIVMQLQRLEDIIEDAVDDLLTAQDEEGEPRQKRKTNIWGRES
ncbi:MAG: hypothetical protein JXA52_00055 [Planctomycetes bacterium]|nr:hypothetical protein [Planctomycetota bacterium]